MTRLLDANVLIALAFDVHVHHDRVESWIAGIDRFATCPITQGALVRMALRNGESAVTAAALLRDLAADDRHVFWPDDLPFVDVSMAGVIGHRQVTDAYLAGLARARGATLSTLDAGLAALHPDVAELISAG